MTIIIISIPFPKCTTNLQIHTSKQHSCVQGPLRQCFAIRSGASGLLISQSGPENPSVNLVLLHSQTKTFVGTDLVVFFRFNIGSQHRKFEALQWGKWQAGRTRTKSRQHTRHILSAWNAHVQHKLLYMRFGRTNSSCVSYDSKSHGCSYTSTAHVALARISFKKNYLPRAGRLFKALWN